MADFCSTYCGKFDHCDKLGIIDFMKVIPKHPNEVNKNWCRSFEEAENSKE